MARALFLLLIVGISFAVPSCPHYPYRDYVWASVYHPPEKPADTLLCHCEWNLDPMCLLTNLLNTTEDKRFFIAESIANNSFEDIAEWNRNIDFGKYPPESSESSANIKDAWVSIAYLDPSVYDNGTYLITDSTNPLIRQAFTFVVDRRRLSGDCKDVYRICGYDYSIDVGSTDSRVTDVMDVESEYLVDRYRLVLHCSMSGCWTTCDYYRTDSFTDEITVSDEKRINRTSFSPQSDHEITSYFNNMAKIRINASDPEVLFAMGKSSLYSSDHMYLTRKEAGPYSVLVKEIIPAEVIAPHGLSILEQNESNFTVLVPYSENCSLRMSNHFTTTTISGCNLSNISNSTGSYEIEVEDPEFFDHILEAVLLLFVIYILYLIAKKVMPSA